MKGTKLERTKECNLHKQAKPTYSRKFYKTKSEYPTLNYVLQSDTSTQYAVNGCDSRFLFKASDYG